jgi:hypothetical protein
MSITREYVERVMSIVDFIEPRRGTAGLLENCQLIRVIFVISSGTRRDILIGSLVNSLVAENPRIKLSKRWS